MLFRSAPSGNTYPLGSDKTVGISVSNGTVEWTTPGYYVCGGGLSFLRANVLCRYSGAAHRKGSTYTMAGVTAVLEGFDPATGASTWSVPVRGAKALSIGANLAFADATHVVVQLASGKRVLLDVRTGADTPIRSGTSYWCEQIPLYRVNAPTGAVAAGKRQGSAVFSPCTATGSPADRLPATAPSTVGVRVGTSFVWPTRHGLRGIRR